MLDKNQRKHKMIKRLYRFLNPKFQSIFLDYKVDFKPRYGHGKAPHGDLYKIIDAHRETYVDLLQKALKYKETFWEMEDMKLGGDPTKPSWNNGFLPGLDMITIYTCLAEFRPKKYIEIGSGNSTKVAYKAKQEQGLDTQIISIDPMPRAEIDQLADEVIRMPFEDIDYDLVEALEENDILFVNNSHRILPNSDSMVFFMEVLPRLKKGVIVQLHDIYLPYDYPQFMCERFYSEQYGLAMCLLANPKKYQSILPNYFISEDEALSYEIAPVWEHTNMTGVERHGGSFWLRIME